MLTFTVDKQILKRTDTDKTIADSVKYLTATFTFSEDWTGTTKTVLFNRGTVTYAMILESDTCVVPWEVIHSDYFRVSVYGVKDDERITTNNVTVYVGESGYREGGEPQPPTPSQIEQILQILSNLTGGAANKVLAKKSSQDYDFKWVNNEGGGGGGSSVEWEQILESGTKIATITIDDEPFDVYAPTPFSGAYADLTGKPTIPTKVSDLVNDSNFSVVSANPTTQGGEADLTSIEIDGTKYNIPSSGSPYVLPQATASALGGIKASPKTELETNEVKIDEATGKLYSKAGSTGSGITEDEAKALILANEYRWEAKEGTIHCGELFSNNIMDLSTKGYPYTCLEYTFDGHETKVRLSAEAGGSSSNHAYCFVDSNNNILLTDEWSSGATYKNLVLDVPSGSYKLYVNGSGSTSAHLEVGYVDHVSDPHTGLYVHKYFGKKLQYKETFAWKPMPTGLIALTFDDSLGELSDLVDYAIEKGVPICFGCIPERLNATTEAGDETIAQAMHRQINSTAGGEVLAHGGYIITEENIDNYEYLYEKFVIYKQKLLDAGFDVRGIVRTGGSEHGYENIENDPRTDVWVRLFFDYSDAYGVAEPYNHYRFTGSSEADYKNAVDTAITQKRFMPLLFHSAPDFLDDLIDYIEAQGGQIVTYADVYDTYGSNAETVDILRRLTALEGGSTPTLSSITAVKNTVAYSVGDLLNTSDISVTAHYSDSSSEDVTSSAVINTSNVDMNTAGTYAINVSYTYGGTTATTTISITVSAIAKVLDSISAVKTVTSYAVGSNLNTSDISVTAHYTDSTSATVAGTYDTSNVNMNTAGTYSIGVSYTENNVTKTTSVSITVSSISYIIDHDTATGTSISDGEFVGSTFTSVAGHTYHVEFDYSFDVTATHTVNAIDVKGGAWWDAAHYALQLSRVQTGTVSGHASADIPCGTGRSSGDYGSNVLRFALNNLSIGNYSITNLCVWEV